MKQQSTHWYKAPDGGWTSQWQHAAQGEVERVGLHDCGLIGCSEEHSGSTRDFGAHLVQATNAAQDSASDERPRKLRKVKKR